MPFLPGMAFLFVGQAIVVDDYGFDVEPADPGFN
jgi:hypothetical protein